MINRAIAAVDYIEPPVISAYQDSPVRCFLKGIHRERHCRRSRKPVAGIESVNLSGLRIISDQPIVRAYTYPHQAIRRHKHTTHIIAPDTQFDRLKALKHNPGRAF